MILRLASRYRGIGLALAVVAGLAGTLPAAAQGQAPHHDIILTLDPAVGAVKVRDRIQISGRNDIALRLTTWMRTTDIRLDGQPTSTRFADGYLTLTLPSAGPHQIDIMAEGTVARDAAGDQVDPASVPFASTDGLYLPGWVEWFPQTADGKETFRLTVETPPDIRAAATGKFESETLGATRNTVVFSTISSQEAPSVFAGPYTVEEMSIAGVRIRAYFHKPIERLAREGEPIVAA